MCMSIVKWAVVHFLKFRRQYAPITCEVGVDVGTRKCCAGLDLSVELNVHTTLSSLLSL